jgi:hypothetical protein
MELMEKSFNRNDPLYDELRIAWKKANQAHSELTSPHVYQKKKRSRVGKGSKPIENSGDLSPQS